MGTTIKKPRTSEKSKTVIWVALAIVLLVANIGQFWYYNYYSPRVLQEDVPISLSELYSQDKTELIGKTFTVEGYLMLLSSNRPVLIENITDYLCNADTPYGKWLDVSGSVAAEILAQNGSRVNIKGKIESKADSESGLQLHYSIGKVIERFGTWGISEYHALLNFSQDFFTDKYALLISGGSRPSKAYARYWNDLKFMYSILINKYAYDPANIIVIYKDGVGEDAEMPVNYSATYNNLETAFTYLGDTMDPKYDRLFVFTTNHGTKDNLCLYHSDDASAGPTITRTDFLGLVLKIESSCLITFLMVQCFSGSFIRRLSASDRIIMTACTDIQNSWACDTEGSYDEFCYYWMSAMNQAFPDGESVTTADENGNGRISMEEAFKYAASHDSCDEEPWYDGNGDDIPSTLDDINEGTLGNSTYL